MSAIFGILSLEGPGVDAEQMDEMAKAVAHWGVGGPIIWIGEGLALGSIHSREPVPIGSSEKHSLGVRIAVSARLDNRKDLFQKLGVVPELQAGFSDSALILEAYLKFGEACPEHLLGDWTFAIWDARESKLLLARDQVGMNPLYYHTSGSSICFSTSIRSLLALPGVPKNPNLMRIARTLATWPTDGIDTCYEAISKLPSGSMLVFQNGNASVRKYWEPPTEPASVYSSEAEYFEAFLELYSEAVRCRMRDSQKVGVTLSGGLDSGSVAALAARELRTSGVNLQAFSSTPIHPYPAPPGRFGDETPFIEAERRFIGNLDVHYVHAERCSPVRGIDRVLELSDEPLHGISNAFWIVAIMEAAQKAGVDSLLTGQQGNFTISWGGDRFISPWERFKLLAIMSWAKPLRNRYRRLKHHGQHAWITASPLNERFIASKDIAALRKQDGYDPDFVAPTNAHAQRLLGIQVSLNSTSASWTELGVGYGLRIADPTFDKRIIEFCLKAPVKLFRVDGMNRRLIRKSMAGLLPDEVRLNTQKGWQASDLGTRLSESSDEVEEAFAEMARSSLASEVLDIPKMKRAFEAAKQNPNFENTSSAGAVLMRGLHAGKFLMRF